MMVSAIVARPRTAGDVILAVVADEERGSHAGARHLVEHHAELFDGVRYALGEFGGFSQEVAGRRLYPIQVAEKQKCAILATVRGPAGHGSLPWRGGTSAKLAALLRALDRRRTPVHVTDVARRWVEAMADALPAPAGVPLRGLLNPRLTDAILRALGETGRQLEPALRNTVNPVVVRAGTSNNVVPAEATVELDCRILPGFTADDMVREVRALVGSEVELEVTRYDPAPTDRVDYGLFELLAGALREHDPGGTPVPMLLPGITDGRIFGQLGIQHYGFLPLRLPKELRFTELIHAADERVPVAALDFGTAAIGTALERYGR
jgi:acetylornithine deacetylase/succinyl-diaminopimelate desuccinylase-like protein